MLLLVVFVLFCFVVGLGFFICLWVMCFKGWFFSFFPSFTCPLILLLYWPLPFFFFFFFSSSSFFCGWIMMPAVWKRSKKIYVYQDWKLCVLNLCWNYFYKCFCCWFGVFFISFFFRWFVSMGEMAKWRRLWTGIKRVQMYEWTNEWKFIYSA